MIMTSAPGLGRQDDQNAAVDRRAVTASADTGVAGMRRRVADGRERLERLLLWRVWERMLEIEFVDRSVALAGKAFVSFFPLVIVVAAFVPDRVRSSIITTLSARLGIRGDALAAVKEAFASSDDVRKATGVVGLVFTIFFATSFTTALQRAYLHAWRRPPGARTGAYWRGATWLLAILGSMAVLGFARGALDGAIGVGLFAILSLSVTSALWWFTAWLLLLGDVRPRVLLPTAVITSVALAGVRALRHDLDAGRGEWQRRPVRLLRHRALARHVVFGGGDLRTGRRVCRPRVRGGSRSRRHVHPGRRSDDAERRRPAFATAADAASSACATRSKPAISHECNEATRFDDNAEAERNGRDHRSQRPIRRECAEPRARSARPGPADSGSGRGASSASSSRPPS